MELARYQPSSLRFEVVGKLWADWPQGWGTESSSSVSVSSLASLSQHLVAVGRLRCAGTGW